MPDIPQDLFIIVYDNVAVVLQMKNGNNVMLSRVSDDSRYEDSEEEASDDYHDSHQCAHRELPPKALDFYPMSSLFALLEVSYK